MVLSYDHWDSHEVAQVASALKERYGPGFVGKALHEIQSNGHQSELVHVMLVSAKEPSAPQTWAQSAKQFLMGYGRYLYNRLAQLLESMDATGAVVRAKIVPAFLVELYKRSMELATATGKTLRRAARFVMENAKSLWMFIRNAIFGDNGLTEEEADLLQEASEQTSYLRTAASAVASWLARWFYGIGRGIAKICSAAMGIMKEVVQKLMAVTNTTLRCALELPVRLSRATALFHRKAIYAINFAAAGIAELMSSWTEGKKRYAEKYKKFLKSVNDAIEGAVRLIRQASNTPVGTVLLSYITDIPEVDAHLRFLGMLVVRDPTMILTTLVSAITYMVVLVKSFIAAPLAFAQSYMLGFLSLIAQVGANLIAKSTFGNAYVDHSLQGFEPLVKAADEWGSLKGKVEAKARRRCRNAADMARKFVELCNAHRQRVDGVLQGRSAADMYRHVHLSAELLTQAHFDEEIDEEKLNQLSQSRYGLDHTDFMEAIVTLRSNLTMQINAAVSNMQKVADRKKEAGVEQVGYEALNSATTTKEFVDTLRANTEHTGGWFSWLPWKVRPTETLADNFRKIYENASLDTFDTVQGVREATAMVEDELQKLRAAAQSGFDTLDALTPSASDVTRAEIQHMYAASITERENLARTLRATLDKIEAGKIVLSQAKYQVLQLKNKKSQVQSALLGIVILISTVCIYTWVNAYTPRQLKDEATAVNDFLDVEGDGKSVKKDQVIFSYYKKWHASTGKLISDEFSFYEFSEYLRLQALHLERGDLARFTRGDENSGLYDYFFPPTEPALDQGLPGMFDETFANSQSLSTSMTAEEIQGLFAEATKKIGIFSGVPGFDSYETPIYDGWYGQPKGGLYYQKGSKPDTYTIFAENGTELYRNKKFTLKELRLLGMQYRIKRLIDVLRKSVNAMEIRAEKSFSALKKSTRISAFFSWLMTSTKSAIGIEEWNNLSWEKIKEIFSKISDSVMSGGDYYKVILAGVGAMLTISSGIFLTILTGVLLFITVMSNYLLGDWEDENWSDIPTIKMPMKVYQEYMGSMSTLWKSIIGTTTALVGVIAQYRFSMVSTILTVVSFATGGWVLTIAKGLYDHFKEWTSIKTGVATTTGLPTSASAQKNARLEEIANEHSDVARKMTVRLEEIQRRNSAFEVELARMRRRGKGKKKKPKKSAKARNPPQNTGFGGGPSSARF